MKCLDFHPELSPLFVVFIFSCYQKDPFPNPSGNFHVYLNISYGK